MLFPISTETSVPEAYDGTHRLRHHDRAWIVMTMISTADGAVSLEGNSALLGGPCDREVFLYLHRSANCVLVGAETVRQEAISPLPGHQTLIIVSHSGELGPNSNSLLSASNTRIVAGEVQDIARQLPGDMCVLEGGANLNGQMLAADLVDEICLTVAPRFISGNSSRLAYGPWAIREPWHLAHICHDEGFVFLRYLRQTSIT